MNLISMNHGSLILLILLVIISGCSSIEGFFRDDEHQKVEEPSMKNRVLVVHGLFRTHRAMRPLVKPIQNAGYEVLEYRYPTTQLKVEDHAEDLRKYLLQLVEEDPDRSLRLVGHSLGAVISVMATTPAIPGIDRVLQISPPNQGSPVADRFEGMFGKFIAPLKELSASTGGPLPSGDIPGTPTGVIAAESDQLVPISCTQLRGSVDHIQLPGTHTFVFWRDKTQKEIIYFLDHGRFSETATRVTVDQES